jgi:hypothetical protein
MSGVSTCGAAGTPLSGVSAWGAVDAPWDPSGPADSGAAATFLDTFLV